MEFSMKKTASAMLIALGTVLGSSGLALAQDPTGTWMLSDGKITVRVSECADNLCAKLVALKEPLDKQGKPKVDKRNPDPSLRKRPLIGVTVLSKMQPAGENEWEGGTIYNPDDGKTYSASMKLSGNTMKVKACIAGFLCQTKSFKRIN
jgi:uncharacterized protein (DUF2147 family)